MVLGCFNLTSKDEVFFMDFVNQVQALAERIEKQNTTIASEEATKNTFVLPFIQALGYDIFNPKEVLSEFTADGGRENGEKVDYAILIDDKPTLLFECKAYDFDLSNADPAQLRKCFHAASAGIGVLTNGKSYYFYSDIEEKSVMDDKPFMEIILPDIDAKIISVLIKLSKNSFDLAQVLAVSAELKYIAAIKNVLSEEFSSPSLELVQLLVSRVQPKIKTKQVVHQFGPIVKGALKQYIDDCVKDRFLSMKGQAGKTAQAPYTNTGYEAQSHHDIFITNEEFEEFFVVNVAPNSGKRQGKPDSF
jgi:predicted type IV restriction endonuclease